MSSPEDMFNDSSDDMKIEDFTPPSLDSNSIKSSQGFKSQPPPSQTNSVQSGSDIFDIREPLTQTPNIENVGASAKIKVEFFDSSGVKTCARFSTDPEIITLVGSMLQSANPDYRNSAVQKLVKSERFGSAIQDTVVAKLSKIFSSFLSLQDCPLRSQDFFSNAEEIESLDLDQLLEKCRQRCPRLVEAVNQILFGTVEEYNKKRLLTVLMISGFTQNQKINLVPKLMGEFFKRKNCSKEGLELLQICGITLVSKSVSRDQDKIGEQFLSEVEERKKMVIEWVNRRKVLGRKVMMEDKKLSEKYLKVKFVNDDFSIKMIDIGELGK